MRAVRCLFRSCSTNGIDQIVLTYKYVISTRKLPIPDHPSMRLSVIDFIIKALARNGLVITSSHFLSISIQRLQDPIHSLEFDHDGKNTDQIHSDFF
jgi:hypothetical protein